ncbi:phosphopantetheine-binding protein [Streptomyces sp. NPDC059651]|uniref:phosphopantetheine-binding protein n=1 Tax=Streptomyces sp. NPDC059651 TaxID=3346897 RepID=UPI0036B2D7E6
MSGATGGTTPPSQQEIESWVIGFCRQLGLPVEDGESDFFSAGGTSLTAMRLIASAEERYGEEALPPEDLFEHSRLSQIAAVIGKNSGLVV